MGRLITTIESRFSFGIERHQTLNRNHLRTIFAILTCHYRTAHPAGSFHRSSESAAPRPARSHARPSVGPRSARHEVSHGGRVGCDWDVQVEL
jgi:hypothetical protein